MNPQMVAFDVAGTTVADEGMVIAAFSGAFARTQPELWEAKADELMAYAIKTMGQSKIDVFTHLVGDHLMGVKANTAFEEVYLEEVEKQGVVGIAGAEECFDYLLELNVPVVLTTGFSRRTLDAILHTLNWKNEITFSVTPQEAGRGRPFPDMLQFAAQRLQISNPANTIILGDTVSDMQAGVAFGSNHVIGVLTGVHSKAELIGAKATHVLNSVAGLQTFLQAN